MSRDFAMLKAARKLENYLSREMYNLDKMKVNDRVPMSLFDKKVEHFNGLVSTLNGLFSELIDDDEPLFSEYSLTDDGTDHAAEPLEDGPVVVTVPEAPVVVTPVEPPEPEPEPTEPPEWQLANYDSEAEWLADKDREMTVMTDDLATGVDVDLSKHRIAQSLDEYNSAGGRDITEHDPESDVPVSVLDDGDPESHAPAAPEVDVPDDSDEAEDAEDMPTEDAAADSDSDDADDFENDDGRYSSDARPTESLGYMNRTIDNERVDDDPAQIVNVKTAVERAGTASIRGTDIDIFALTDMPNDVSYGDVIDDDILKHSSGGAVDDATGDENTDATDDEESDDIPERHIDGMDADIADIQHADDTD